MAESDDHNTNVRHSTRNIVFPLNQLEDSEANALNGLHQLLEISPDDNKESPDQLRKIDSNLKCARDKFTSISREFTARLSDVGHRVKSHFHRQQRSSILADVFEQINDINMLISSHNEDEISNVNLRSEVSSQYSVNEREPIKDFFTPKGQSNPKHVTFPDDNAQKIVRSLVSELNSFSVDDEQTPTKVILKTPTPLSSLNYASHNMPTNYVLK